jgi:hypothetical protein
MPPKLDRPFVNSYIPTQLSVNWKGKAVYRKRLGIKGDKRDESV